MESDECIPGIGPGTWLEAGKMQALETMTERPMSPSNDPKPRGPAAAAAWNHLR